MTTFALVRHGETAWNAAHRLQGSADIGLNDTGREQARAAGRRLAQERTWDAVVTSPMLRAAHTADIIAAELSLSVTRTGGDSPDRGNIERDSIERDLVERDFGAAEGMTVWQAYDTWPHGHYPGMEPRQAVAARAVRALKRLANDHPGEHLVVVTHGGVIRVVIDVVHHFRSPRIANGAISTLIVNGNDWQITQINDQPLRDDG